MDIELRRTPPHSHRNGNEASNDRTFETGLTFTDLNMIHSFPFIPLSFASCSVAFFCCTLRYVTSLTLRCASSFYFPSLCSGVRCMMLRFFICFNVACRCFTFLRFARVYVTLRCVTSITLCCASLLYFPSLCSVVRYTTVRFFAYSSLRFRALLSFALLWCTLHYVVLVHLLYVALRCFASLFFIFLSSLDLINAFLFLVVRRLGWSVVRL